MVPDHIPRPDYAEDGTVMTQQRSNITLDVCKIFTGKPKSEMQKAGQPPRILSLEEQEKMRAVCRVSSNIYI